MHFGMASFKMFERVYFLSQIIFYNLKTVHDEDNRLNTLNDIINQKLKELK